MFYPNPFFLTWNPEDPIDIETRENLAAQLKPVLEPFFDIFRSLSSDLIFIELKTKMGTPLEGSCIFCLKIKSKIHCKPKIQKTRNHHIIK